MCIGMRACKPMAINWTNCLNSMRKTVVALEIRHQF